MSHANGELQRLDRLYRKRMSAHTGGIDNAWKMMKSAIPSALASKKDGLAARMLMHYATHGNGNGGGKTLFPPTVEASKDA